MVPILPNFSLGDLLLLYFNSHKYNQTPHCGHPLNTDTKSFCPQVTSPRLHLAPFSRTTNITFTYLIRTPSWFSGYRSFRPQVISPPSHFASKSFCPQAISPQLHLALFSRTRNMTFVIFFASSPGKQSPCIFSKFNRLYTNTPLIRTLSIPPPPPASSVSKLTGIDCKCIQPFSNLTTANISAPSEA